jgi:hypothetical protein
VSGIEFSTPFFVLVMKRVAFGEPNSKHGIAACPLVNALRDCGQDFTPPENPNLCNGLAALGECHQFSVPENDWLGTRRNPQGCDRTPRFLGSNSLILWLI